MLWLLARLKQLAAWLDLVLFTLLMMLLARLPLRWLAGFYPALFHAWCRCFVRALGVELRLHQHQSKPLPEHFILIANHPSAFEDVGIPALFPVVSLAKEEVRDWWFVGRIAEAAGTLFVQRESKDSRQAALQAMIEGVKGGRNIALYPEGGCKGRRLWEKFLYGAFTVSLETGVPIVPVFLHYEAQEAFEWAPGETLLQKIRAIITAPNHTANYHVFDPLYPADFADRESYSAHAYQQFLNWQARFLD
ncbi:1-acyl-sn-glycerol-3-phosphate acyltransferase [Andreprevotia lacus DSM 23236]|jgi:1-acyl-sn-glycerol-3-phosphate acyltransferase|uniref:1-acyl-sn-glycerol-3-phosphate acyltransferase n=1 Tax=Andreprevotia lacus DSM 23236 TaxID=1121001 RepID=A0A1W1XQE5_9NEIS|nr:lysophospholipid acyltransferase family protein [Andreprevotia lacus]SMC26183.1 1-acyl-sn-glycerol-3-phosphate acyltransferase [Andreprevotia lacus DSM 23236]